MSPREAACGQLARISILLALAVQDTLDVCLLLSPVPGCEWLYCVLGSLIPLKQTEASNSHALPCFTPAPPPLFCLKNAANNPIPIPF